MPKVSPAKFILEVDKLRVSYNAKVAVDNVSFSIKHGEVFGLLGPNGAGKTSALSAIEGLVTPQSGALLLNGMEMLKHP
jgi:ABC-2 type transport system ATP-binding protein